MRDTVCLRTNLPGAVLFLVTVLLSSVHANNCGNLLTIECGECVTGNTMDEGNDHDCGTGHDGYDTVYRLELSQEQQVQLVGEADFDADWSIATECDISTGDILCVDSAGDHQDVECGGIVHVDWSFVNVTNTLQPGNYYIWVDGYYPETGGNYAFQLICTDPPPTPTPTPLAGNECNDTINLACGDCVTGNTTGYTNNHDCGTGHDGPDVVYQFEIPESSQVQFIGEADYDADWTIATTCDENTGDLLCIDFQDPHLDPACGDLIHTTYGYMNHTTILDPGAYFIWIDGYTAAETGNYALEILCNPAPTFTPTPTPTDPPTLTPVPVYIAESISLTDTTAVYPPLPVQVTETIALTDSASVWETLQVSITETIQIADAPTLELAPSPTPSPIQTSTPTTTPTISPPTHTPTPNPPTATPTPVPPTSTPTPPCIHHGDVNFSGSLSAEDAQIIFNIVLGFVTPTYEEACAADCDNSGSITAGDSQTVFYAVLGMGSGCVD